MLRMQRIRRSSRFGLLPDMLPDINNIKMAGLQLILLASSMTAHDDVFMLYMLIYSIILLSYPIARGTPSIRSM